MDLIIDLKKYKQLIKTISAVTLTLSVNFEQHFMYISTLKLMWDTLQYVDIKFLIGYTQWHATNCFHYLINQIVKSIVNESRE